jgi:hypothetical protein
MVIFELRFLDGPGTRVFTSDDVSGAVGKPEVLRTIPIAAEIGKQTPVADAMSCLRRQRTLTLVANMGAVAYVVRHETAD